MTRLLIIVSLWSLHLQVSAESLQDRIVKTKSGTVMGVQSDVNAKVSVFRGIPYAAPPVGELRWRPPQPAEPWEGIRKCEKFGNRCVQPLMFLNRSETTPMSEDCLYLNVWTAAKDSAEKLPVMVWIHGGGFTIGSGSQPCYEGSKLATKGVVVVTINYRIGPLGFFGHPALSKESPNGVSGNYGLMDQIAALRWVRDNISAFGGDPNSVTIFGESAGGVSVSTLLVMPEAKGLFHRAICESGVSTGIRQCLKEDYGSKLALEKIGVNLSKELGCDKAPDVLVALRSKSPQELLDVHPPQIGFVGKGLRYWPVVDGVLIPDFPGKLFEAGKFHRVPVMAGSNADDGSMFAKAVPMQRPFGYKLVIKGLFKENSENILSLFPAETKADVRPTIRKLMTISCFVEPSRWQARVVAKHGVPGYLYHFARVAPGMKKLGYGAEHGFEIVYVFGYDSKRMGLSKTDWELSDLMQDYWIAFAKTGKPAPKGRPPIPIHTVETDQYMLFDAKPAVKSGLFPKECDLFADLRESQQ